MTDSMKILFFYIGTPSPILETELELIKKHEKLGDDILVLQCAGELPSCHWNIGHNNSQCARCRSKFENGWKVLNPGANVTRKNFPSKTISDISFPTTFKSVDEINNFQHDTEYVGFGVTASLVSILRDHRFDTEKYQAEIKRGLTTAVQVYDALKSEIHEFKPDRIYLFNGRIATHLPAKLLCQKLGIEYYSYEVSRKNNNYRLLSNKVNHDVVPPEEVREMESHWSPEQELLGTSILERMRFGGDIGKTKTFTQGQREGLLPRDFDPEKRNIAIFNSTIDEYVGIQNSNNKIYQPDETAGVCKILESFASDSRFYFYLRTHPHMKEVPSTTSQLVDIRELEKKFSNVRVIWPEEEVDTYALLSACEKIVTFGSTVGIEATFWGKPSILADKAKYENFGYAYRPDSHEELVALLQDELAPMPRDSAAKILYSVSVDGIPYEYFRETGSKNGLTVGTFDGAVIEASIVPRLGYWLSLFPVRLGRVLRNPSLVLHKFKSLMNA